jgi:hypothetical protein
MYFSRQSDADRLKNRRWYEWIYIVLGVIGVVGQLLMALSLLPGKFSWLQLLVAFAFLWFGTVPRKPRP